MIFVIAAIFILVVSFVIALVSLVREQSKIEKAANAASSGAGQINVQEPQAVEKKSPEPELANLNFPQSQAQSQPQPQIQTQTQDENLNAVNLAQKPWWESEIQKRDEQPSGHAVDWQNTGQSQPHPADVLKTEESVKVPEPPDSLGAQTSLKNNQNLQGSFSVSDLKTADQES